MTLIQFIMIALQTHRVSDTRSLRVDTPVRLLSGSGARGSGNLCSARTEVERRPTRYKAFLPNYGNNNTHPPLNLPSPIYQP